MIEASWIHPWIDFRADVVRAGREFMAGRLVVPDHVARTSSVGYPDGLPGSDEEAQSYSLNLLTGSALRSLCRSGYLALCGLPLESVGVHRRTIETLLQIDVLVDDISLSRPCCGLAFSGDRKNRKQNEFYRAMARRTQVINNLQVPETDLTPLERELRRSANDAGLHLGPHAGLQHGVAGKRWDKVNALNEFDPFDVGQTEVGPFLWRYAAQTWRLCTVLLPKLDWVDSDKWLAASPSLEDMSAQIETQDRERRKDPSDGTTPWSNLPKGTTPSPS